jgi:hypothetical protein
MGKKIIICGSGECLFDDLARNHANAFPHTMDVACINHTALYYPYFFEHWISWHSNIFAGIREFVKGNPTIHSSKEDTLVHRVWGFPGFECSDSGLFAVKICLALGYDRIILCGIPMDNSRKFYEAYGTENGHAADNIQDIWKKEIPSFKDCVRSMSGNTRAMLGEPTREWFNV